MHHFSLERIYPADGGRETIAGNETLQLHLQRYHFAGKYLLPGVIADVACGAGYGSYLLATEYGKDIEQIIAVDNCTEAIEYAKTHYSHSLIDYQLKDVFDLQSPCPLNTIISLETIEHLIEPEKFVQHFSSLLVKGGRFIASAPVTPSMDANPFHQRDFTVQSFKKLFMSSGLVEINSLLQVQQYKAFTLLSKKDRRSEDIRKGLAGYYLQHPGKFFLRLKSILTDGFTNKYLLVVFEKK